MDPLTREAALEFLAGTSVAHLGVISEGLPYVTPMSFVIEGKRILFRTQAGRKFDAIAASPSVCIEASSFDESTGDWVSVIVTGSAHESTDPATGELAVEMLFEKYAAQIGSPLGVGGLQPMAGMPHVVEVTIENVTGMSSGSGFHARTRPGRL